MQDPRRYQLAQWQEKRGAWVLMRLHADTIGDLIASAAALGLLNALVIDHEVQDWVAHVNWNHDLAATEVQYNDEHVRVTRMNGLN